MDFITQPDKSRNKKKKRKISEGAIFLLKHFESKKTNKQ